MLASLPMYDLPELARATDAWWLGLRRHFVAQGIADLPATLTQPKDPIAHQRDDGVIFTHTCGFPLTHALKGRVKLVATPRFSAPGCAGPTYVSWIVVRTDDPIERPADLKGRRAAFNGRDSQSGYNAFRDLVAALAEHGRFFGAAIESGAHRRSLAMVRAGEADAAAIDCVSFALIARAAPEEVRGVRVLWATRAAPNLPYVTAAATSEDDLRRLRDGVAAAFADRGLAETRAALLLEGCAFLPLSCYDVIPAMEQAAAQAGYPELA